MALIYTFCQTFLCLWKLYFSMIKQFMIQNTSYSLLSGSSFLYCVFQRFFFLPERGSIWYLGIMFCLSFCPHVTPRNEAVINIKAIFLNTTSLCLASSKDIQSEVKLKYVYWLNMNWIWIVIDVLLFTCYHNCNCDLWIVDIKHNQFCFQPTWQKPTFYIPLCCYTQRESNTTHW